MKLKRVLVMMASVIFSSHALAESDEDLAKAALNPLARNPESKYYTLPFIDYLNFGYGPNGRTQDVLELKPIIPLQITTNYDFILRPIIPLYHQPATSPSTGYINGWGDLNPTVFISPSQTNALAWGAGPNLFIPTATNQAFGTGKWSLGPQLALFYMPESWQIGFLTSNVWSIAGDPSRAAVNQFSFQYFISYHFPKGWYITSQPTITANWKAAGSQQWTVPFGIGPGRTFKVGKQRIDISLQSYFNAIHPSNTSSDWTLQLKLDFLFPDQVLKYI